MESFELNSGRMKLHHKSKKKTRKININKHPLVQMNVVF